ncbi:MAG: hypothetical protein QOJ29_4561 [Thermoleophilaceae bacterium]|nr:hypothetical protein [Thermoleophilaceae bacterium]
MTALRVSSVSIKRTTARRSRRYSRSRPRPLPRTLQVTFRSRSNARPARAGGRCTRHYLTTMVSGRERLAGLDWGAIAVEPYQLVRGARLA